MMRCAFAVLACLCWLGGVPQALAFDDAVPALAAQGTLRAAFTPWDDIEALIVEAIDDARAQVLVQAYLLTNRRIANTLIAAHRRGIDVRVLADAGQLAKTERSLLPELAAAGIAVWIETKYQNAHNKIIVIDAAAPQATVITGSFNLTWSAQHANAENILIAHDNPALAARYAMNWERHRRDAYPYR
ncbi:MAG TPA: phospholipase D family protein [Burkholderiaceae bacterium]|nr:phospholipase D family protein [Burkholderiaceae bacterium]